MLVAISSNLVLAPGCMVHPTTMLAREEGVGMATLEEGAAMALVLLAGMAT